MTMKKKITVGSIEDLFEQVCNELRLYEIPSVSDVSGVSHSTLYRWANGYNSQGRYVPISNPRSNQLFAVADALGFDITWKRG